MASRISLRGSQKNTCLGHRLRSRPRRGHCSLSLGPRGFGTGSGQSFPDVPLKCWLCARKPHSSTKGASSPCSHSSLERGPPRGQGLQKHFRGDHLQLFPPTANNFTSPSFPRTHKHTHFPPTTSSGFYSNKAKAKRVCKSSNPDSDHREGQRK